MEPRIEKAGEVNLGIPESKLNYIEKLKQTLEGAMPVKIVEKVVYQHEEKDDKGIIFKPEESVYEISPAGASYYWLVEFSNGDRIPFPLMNLEGINASPFRNGSIQKSDADKEMITEQENIIKEAYKTNPEIKNKFDTLRDALMEPLVRDLPPSRIY